MATTKKPREPFAPWPSERIVVDDFDWVKLSDSPTSSVERAAKQAEFMKLMMDARAAMASDALLTAHKSGISKISAGLSKMTNPYDVKKPEVKKKSEEVTPPYKPKTRSTEVW